MSKLISMSEAVSIAMHGMILIARSEKSINVQDIVEATNTSKHHVAKVMQRLVKENFLSSQRGPTGGFVLKKKANEISLLNIWEAIEGKIEITNCPLDKPICAFEKCFLNNVTNKFSHELKKYLEETTLDKI